MLTTYRASVAGEMFDVEKLSDVCAQTGRYTFFFSSWPLAMSVSFPIAHVNVPLMLMSNSSHSIGGCASPPNAAVSPLPAGLRIH